MFLFVVLSFCVLVVIVIVGDGFICLSVVDRKDIGCFGWFGGVDLL